MHRRLPNAQHLHSLLTVCPLSRSIPSGCSNSLRTSPDVEEAWVIMAFARLIELPT